MTAPYTPTASFLFATSDYTPTPTFVFTSAVEVATVTATANATLAGAIGSAIGAVAVVSIGAATLNGAVGAATAIISGETAGGYTPTASFVFATSDYTPTPTFVFNASGAAEPVTVTGYANATLAGAIGSAEGAVAVVGTGNATLNGAIGAAVGAIVNNLGIGNATLNGAIGSAVGHYDANVKRVTNTQAHCYVQDAKTIVTSAQSVINGVEFVSIQASVTLNNTHAISASVQALPKPVFFASNSIDVRQQSAIALFDSVASVINTVKLIRQSGCFTQVDALAISDSTQSIQDYLTFVINQSHAVQVDMHQRHYSVLKRFYEALNPYTPAAVFNFACTDYTPTAVFSFDGVVVDICEAVVSGVLSTAVDSNIAISTLARKKLCALLADAIRPPQGKSTRIDPPRPPAPPQPPDHQTITIPTKTGYTVNHSIIVKTVIGNHPVPLSRLSLSLDVDSFAWVFSGVLADKTALPLVTMTGNDPVQLSITIDGYEWIVIVESIEQSRSFGNLAINLKGRSLSALLGAPYQVPKSYTSGSSITVQQIAESLLPTGWTLNWQCAEPWIVPANAYSFNQQTIIQALAQLAQDIGAVLIPSRNEQVLTIAPRYPVLPWQFHDVGISPDLIIPESAIITVNTQSRTQSPINAVYVHGGQNGGVLALCRLNGTAGDVLAPTSSNNLITDVTAARALGERILAGMATQPIISGFSLPLGGDFALASVGWLVDVMNERAIINSISIDAYIYKDAQSGSQELQVSQKIGIGENTNNAYSKLMHLLPAQPLLVGTVAAVSGDIAILTLLDGGVITARGVGVVGSNYYVRNGLIESAAPNLRQEEIVI
jgi:hypothetical protein